MSIVRVKKLAILIANSFIIIYYLDSVECLIMWKDERENESERESEIAKKHLASNL